MDNFSAGSGYKRLSHSEAVGLDIIIVNWNSGTQLRECLASIVKHGGNQVTRVVVVDNASADASADGIESQFDLPLKVIHNKKNLGFAKACNQGAFWAHSPYLLFLNPDTRLFCDSLAVPLDFMEHPENRNVGICGIQLVNEQENIARTCANFPSLLRFFAQISGLNKIPGLRGTGVHMSQWAHQSERDVDQVIGAFFFIRRSLFEALDGFDERFFVYFEEVDLSVRARQSGWATHYLPNAQAFHKGGGTSQQVKATRLFYSLRSRLLYGFKHFTLTKAWLLLLLTLVVEPFTRVGFCLLYGNWQGVIQTLQGYKLLWAAVPKVLKQSGHKI